MYGETFYGRHTAQHQLQWRQIIKKESFKRNENIRKKDDESYYVVSANKTSSGWPCNDPATKARGNILQFCEFHIGSRFKDSYKLKWGPNN